MATVTTAPCTGGPPDPEELTIYYKPCTSPPTPAAGFMPGQSIWDEARPLHDFHHHHHTQVAYGGNKGSPPVVLCLSLFSFKQLPPSMPVGSCQMLFDGPLHGLPLNGKPAAHGTHHHHHHPAVSFLGPEIGHASQLLDTQVPSPSLQGSTNPMRACASSARTTPPASTTAFAPARVAKASSSPSPHASISPTIPPQHLSSALRHRLRPTIM
ncbi:UNVERIFIED_CONTAM: hypothetical protein K2H54_052912 [Gekko kuhli]